MYVPIKIPDKLCQFSKELVDYTAKILVDHGPFGMCNSVPCEEGTSTSQGEELER